MAERPRLVSGKSPLSDTRTPRSDLTRGALAVATAPAFDDAYQAAADYARAARAANTVRAYSSDWHHFVSWCESKNLSALPAEPQTVAWYLGHLAQLGRKPATIERRLTSISQAHKQLEHDSPTVASAVRNVLAGIKRTHGTIQDAKAPALVEDLKAMMATLPGDLRGLRDRALLLVGFAGAFRREELAGIEVRDLEWTRAGVVVLLRHSKTDQEGQGRKVGIPLGHTDTCPVHALRAWLNASGVRGGRVFRGVDRWGHLLEQGLCDRTVARVVKRAAGAAGLDPDRYAGHSLRAGLATAAANAGLEERKIMAQTGHKSVKMVRRYIRDAELFRDNVAAQVGL
jgi:site-specific recombinase XerD